MSVPSQPCSASIRKRKASCSGCRALHRDSCALGYMVRKLNRKGNGFGFLFIVEPDEPCPRPTTYKAFLSEPKKWDRPNTPADRTEAKQ